VTIINLTRTLLILGGNAFLHQPCHGFE